jgi:hypothetical protein
MATSNDKGHRDDRGHARAWWPLLVATGSSVLIGYLVGRGRYRRDVVKAFHTIERCPLPIEVRIREGA